MADPIPDEPMNHTPYTPLGTDHPSPSSSVPETLKALMDRYNAKLKYLSDYSNLSPKVREDPTKFMNAVNTRDGNITFVKTEKAYLQSKIDELQSKQ